MFLVSRNRSFNKEIHAHHPFCNTAKLGVLNENSVIYFITGRVELIGVTLSSLTVGKRFNCI